MARHSEKDVDRIEPFWWGLFAAGGGISAMFAPMHILLQDLLGNAGVPVATSSYRRTRRLTANPLVRAYLFALTALSLVHWAHRFRYYVMDLGVTGARRPIALICYGTAVAGSLDAARVLWRLPGKSS
jgi:fumarate reductase subunit D